MASTALASPALARDGQWYVEVGGGPMIVQDTEFDLNNGTDTLTVENDTGYDFGGTVGYDFGAFRLEAEASYREADIDQIDIGAAGVPAGVGPTGIVGRTFGKTAAAGDMTALSFMLNGLFDFGDDDGLQGFAGAGIGVARTDFHASVNSVGPGVVDDSDSGLAWQLLAGVRAPLSDSWDVGLRYRMFNAESVNLVDPFGRDLEGKTRTHSLMGTLTYNFGGAPEPVAPPPPPAPVPVAPPPPAPVPVAPPPPPPCP